MARRNERILDLLVEVPWWVSVALSATAFILLRFVVPAIIPAGHVTSSNYALKGILGAAPMVAPFVAFILLMPAPLAGFRQWRERRLLDKQEDLASIRALTWRRFETLVAEAYRRQGYAVSRPSGNGPDGGVDLVLKRGGNTLLVQCKEWKAWKVGVKIVRELYGVLTARRANGAIIVTSGIFTQEARTFAAGKPIDLVEGEQLAALIRSVQTTSSPAPLSSSMRSSAEAKAADLAVTDTSAPTHPAQRRCPQCGRPMVLRTAQRGAQAGQKFWGCSQFPRCRVTATVNE